MKRKLLTMLLGVVMIFSLTVAVNAAWSTDTVLDIPAFNGSAVSTNSALKTTNDSQGTFQVYSNEAWGLYGVDGRLLNSDGAVRSSWVRDMHSGSILHAPTTAVINHYYWAELSTDALEINEITVSFRFSPDFYE